MDIAIVNGAETAIGREFVLQLHRYVRVNEIWAIARPGTPVVSAGSPSSPNIRFLYLHLFPDGDLQQLVSLLRSNHPRILLLVNAASVTRLPDSGTFAGHIEAQGRVLFGKTGRFLTSSVGHMITPHNGRIPALSRKSLSSLNAVPVHSLYQELVLIVELFRAYMPKGSHILHLDASQKNPFEVTAANPINDITVSLRQSGIRLVRRSSSTEHPRSAAAALLQELYGPRKRFGLPFFRRLL